MKRFNPFGVGRLMRAAICGLLAATVIPAAASADGIVGGVSTPAPVPSVNVSVTTPSVPAVSAPSVSASTALSTPVASVAASASTQQRTTSAQPTKAKPRKKAHGKASKRNHRSAATRSLAMSQTFSATFPISVTNTCVFPAETVVGTGVENVTFDSGTGRSFTTFHGSATALVSGANYTFDESLHIFNGDGPDATVFYFYDYRRATRQGDISSPLGGDDFFLQIFFEVPAGGRPPEMTFAGCR
jgi:hypothetical protein